VPNTGDGGSSMVRPPYVVTPLESLRTALGVDTELVTMTVAIPVSP
jgi:beta-glucosidase